MPHIIRVDKPGWTIYYDCGLRYPVCVTETFYGKLPSAPIRRKDIGEPFKADTAIPEGCRMYWNEYEDYMAYGGSPGHNAPASFHKTSVTDYRRTFLLSNICPQELMFNSGLWLLLENLCREIIEAFPRVDILTGSIKGETKTFGSSRINVPSSMYKIIVVTTEDGRKFAGSYVMPNRPATDEKPVDKFYKPVSFTSKLIYTSMGFDVRRLLGKLGAERVPSLVFVHRLKPVMTRELVEQMKNCRIYGGLVYSKTIRELNERFKAIKNPGEYHHIYYERAKSRLLADSSTKGGSKAKSNPQRASICRARNR